jgi:hypothetical protein
MPPLLLFQTQRFLSPEKTRIALPTADDRVDIERIELNAIECAAGALRSKERGAAAEKRRRTARASLILGEYLRAELFQRCCGSGGIALLLSLMAVVQS